ncbi:MAG TPA: efflux RND transporter periplasmic adaptor subunit [Acetobacteraceae bacterium]|nr:efflux RND transporter periplasmic adaptor subunit [Acetobacteraceae bacterium]
MAKRKFRLPLLVLVIVAAGVGSWLLQTHRSVHASTPSQAADAVAADAQPAVPVTATKAELQDVPVYLRGLGTVQAFNIVRIRAQVNGTLIAVPVTEGQEIQKGQIVAEIDPRPYKAILDEAIAQRAEDLAQLGSARLDLARFQNLAARNFASAQQVDDQQAMVNKLIATAAADEAAIEAARINLDFCTIRAPITGHVGFYQTDVGNLIEASAETNILTIAEDKPISVVFTLPEADLPRIQQVMTRGPLSVFAYSSDGTTKLAEGTLLTPNNAIDTATGTIGLKATFANGTDKLWPGEFVNAWLLIDTLHQVVTIPGPAVQHGPDGLFVYTVKPDDTVAQQAVEIGVQEAGRAVVTKGLRAGENIVVAGQSRLIPGARVAAKFAEHQAGSRVAQD